MLERPPPEACCAHRGLVRLFLVALGLLLPEPGQASVASEDSEAAWSLSAAHTLGQSYMVLGVYDDSLVVRIEVTLSDLARALDLG